MQQNTFNHTCTMFACPCGCSLWNEGRAQGNDKMKVVFGAPEGFFEASREHINSEASSQSLGAGMGRAGDTKLQVTGDPNGARSKHHAIPKSSNSSHRMLYSLGIQPHASSLRHSQKETVASLATRRQPPKRCLLARALSLIFPRPCCSLCLTPSISSPLPFRLSSFHSPSNASPFAQVRLPAAARESHTMLRYRWSNTRYAHTGSGTASVQIKHKENTAPIQQCW